MARCKLIRPNTSYHIYSQNNPILSTRALRFDGERKKADGTIDISAKTQAGVNLNPGTYYLRWDKVLDQSPGGYWVWAWNRGSVNFPDGTPALTILTVTAPESPSVSIQSKESQLASILSALEALRGSF